MSGDNSPCLYCYDNEIMSNFGCKTCKNSLCIKCFHKISQDNLNDVNEVVMNFKCPICRSINIFNYDDFDIKSLKIIATSHVVDSIKCSRVIADAYKLTDDNLKLLYKNGCDLVKKNEELMKTLLSLKHLCDNTKNNCVSVNNMRSLFSGVAELNR
jgi:hypothetical protein